MSNSRFGVKLAGGAAMILLCMTVITQLVKPLIRLFDVSESFVSSVTGIMMFMGIVATVAYIGWYIYLALRIQKAVNPGLVESKSSTALGATVTASILVYALVAIFSIGFKDIGALAMATIIGIISAALAALLLKAAMTVAVREF